MHNEGSNAPERPVCGGQSVHLTTNFLFTVHGVESCKIKEYSEIHSYLKKTE
jgi:hypothetical protein